MSRKLKLYNGGFDRIGEYGHSGHFFVAAYSMSDAITMMNPFSRHSISLHYARQYWSRNAWGNDMDGITPERGLWWKRDGYSSTEKPTRLV